MGEWRGETADAAIEAALAALRTLQEAIGRGAGGRELALAITKLEESQLWLSKVH